MTGSSSYSPSSGCGTPNRRNFLRFTGLGVPPHDFHPGFSLALLNPMPTLALFWLFLLLILPCLVQAAPPNLTASGVIATIDRSETYNLGATGLRGWIWIDRANVGDTTNPTINYIGFYKHDNAAGTVDNLSLTVVPEPRAALLGGLGMLALLRRRRN